MMYLTTGGNGAGKTLFTLNDVRQQQLKENRPVYYHGFEMYPNIAAEFGWKEFDPKKWQDLPDGSICIMDECQNEFPTRGTRDPVPDYINAIAQFRRKRGFDFWLVTPNPSMIDIFIRKLIESPSWHRHMKRAFGGDMVSQLKFGAVDMNCEKPNSGTRAEVTMRAYPKEVYNWYKSSSLHTGKKRIPKQVWYLAACAVLVPGMFWYAFRILLAPAEKAQAASAQSAQTDQPKFAPMTPAEYASSFSPRVGGFPHTAPRYDDVTKPILAPYPAACIEMKSKGCRCFTQQGTVMPIAADICTQIVKNGYFVDWEKPTPSMPAVAQEKPSLVAQTVPAHPVPQTVPMPEPRERAAPAALDSYSQGLAARNAQVRSVLQ